MNLADFVDDKNFSTGETLPEGDTFFDVVNTQVEQIETEYEGKKRIRYKLTTPEKKIYYVGVKVMEGIKKNVEKGFTKVRVTRTGEGKNTTYAVVGVTQ
jgi:hypothetical protein